MLPTFFLSHGSPMHAVEAGAAGRAWAALGRTLPRPRAVLIASAHWETSVPMLTGNPKPQTIHDFGGFPAELYQQRYPAPGATEVAAQAVALLKRADITAGIDGCRGLDHGAWVPLKWMYPQHDIPVTQLSVQPELGAAHHLRLGRALAALREDNVLIIGSGHTTHNLRDWMSNPRRDEPLRYVEAFASWLYGRLQAHDDDAVSAYRERAPEAQRAHPTEEHFLPLLVAWGAGGTDAPVERVLRGYEAGALSLDSYMFDAQASLVPN
ncbi:MAG: class III extradiol ring-cleavage dioxygenase [Betaproteobacteria bacterium]